MSIIRSMVVSLDKPLHIRIDDALDRELRRLAAERSSSIGELVRRALRVAYHLGLDGLTAKQHAALTAYQAGYITLGKLAEEVAMHPVELRRWLVENGFEVHETFAVTDAEHV